MNEDWGFLRACDLARTADENFTLAWIAEIEAAWQVTDLDHGDFGFILVMADGRVRDTLDKPTAAELAHRITTLETE